MLTFHGKLYFQRETTRKLKKKIKIVLVTFSIFKKKKNQPFF